MKFLAKRHLPSCVAAAILSLAASAAFADTFTITYEAPGAQTPTGSTAYETFGTATSDNVSQMYVSTTVGTFNGTFQLTAADDFGGAGGSGVYLKIFGGNSVTLTTPGAQNYFGLWFSALDYGNTVQFYNGTTLVETFDATDFSDAVGSCDASNPYCGNPNDGGDGDEQFAYINFLDTTGSFTSVVFSEFADPSYAFESDNVTVGSGVTSITGTPIGATPEPSSLVLLGSGLGALVAGFRRRIR